MVIADAPPSFSRIPRERVRFLSWSPELEADAVRQMHVGLMPLPDDIWTRGKCSFKMLQYMATGIPVVVSPVGMNADLLAAASPGLAARKDDDWYEALTYFYLHRHQQDYSREVISAKLAAIFKEIANAGHKAPGV